MRLLVEDMNKLMTDFPGAREFIEAAEQRYQAYTRARRVIEKGNRAVAGDACQEEWFLKRLKKEGLPVPIKKEVSAPVVKERKSSEETEAEAPPAKKPAKKTSKKK